MDRTTITINRELAGRTAGIGLKVGHKTMAGSAEFLLRTACDYVRTHGFDKFIKEAANKRPKNPGAGYDVL
jgi:hypothetical protein